MIFHTENLKELFVRRTFHVLTDMMTTRDFHHNDLGKIVVDAFVRRKGYGYKALRCFNAGFMLGRMSDAKILQLIEKKRGEE